MKWLVFTAACVVVLVSLGVLAVDERDAVWEGRQAYCPYCRSELAYYAVACKECDRTLDWSPAREPCPWCLSADDARLLRDAFEALPPPERSDPLPGSLAAFPAAYFRAFGAGSCTYCGGVGEVTHGAEEEVVCPVCRGSGRCVGCAGTRSVLVGDEAAHRRLLAREQARAEVERRATLTGFALRRGVLVDEDVAALRGCVEAETLVDEQDRSLPRLARARLEQAFAALAEAAAAQPPAEAETATVTGG